jgi:hypothetical protein
MGRSFHRCWILAVMLCMTCLSASASPTDRLTSRTDRLPLPLPLTITINGNEVSASINILGIGADFALRFEQAKNLNLFSLGLSVQVINPLDPALLARLPDGDLLSIPLALPLMISVDPPAKGGLSFANAVEVELHTHLLPFAINSPLRIYKAEPGGMFYDITDDIRSGSVRARGRTGGFSDFLILVDLTPRTVAADEKYEYLEQTLLGVPDDAVRKALQTDLAASRSAFDAGNYAGARATLILFEDRVRRHAGTAIPNRWRAQRDLDNVAGELLSEASSLRFALGRIGI